MQQISILKEVYNDHKQVQYTRVQKMINNIAYMLENLVTTEIEPINDYMQYEMMLLNKYRWSILPRLKQFIEKVNQSQRARSIQSPNHQLSYDLQEKINLYESVLAQLGQFHPPEVKQKLLNYYRANQHKITNPITKSCLENLITSQSILNEYQTSKNEVFSIWDEFKDYINLDPSLSLSANIHKIKQYLLRTKTEQVNKLMPFDQATSVSLLLNACIEKVNQKSQFCEYQHILSNIKIETISSPLAALIQLLNAQQKIRTQSYPQKTQQVDKHCIDEKKYHQTQQFMQSFSQIINNIQKIIDPTSSINLSQLNQEELKYLNDKLLSKISQFVQLESRLQQSSQHLSRIAQQNMLGNEQLLHKQRTINQLRIQISKLTNDLQQSKKEIDLQREFTMTLNQSLADKDMLINKLQQTSASRCAKDLREIGQLEELRYSQLANERNELLTQTHNLQHQLSDEKAFYHEKLTQEMEKLTKFMYMEKSKEMDRLEQRRRSEKSKLLKENQELFEELQQFKDKYYIEIGARLNRSRADMSICKSEKGVESNFLEESALLGLEAEGNEENQSHSVSVLEAEFKKQFQDEILKLNKKNAEIQELLGIRQGEIKLLSSKLADQSRQKEEALAKLQERTQKLTIISSQSIIYKKKLSDLLQANKMYESALKQQSNLNNKLQSDSCLPRFIFYQKSLFQGMIFDQDDEGKSILIKHITRYTKKAISKTRLLFQYNPNNKTNFHSFIDNKRGLLCVVKTYKTVLAGFYPGHLTDSVVMNEGGLLISVSNDRSYSLLQKEQNNKPKIKFRGMTYDSYYVVFGNAEMRIRTGENRVFSNFGIQNAYYDYQHSSRSVEEFLGEGESREVEFLYCQFYQIFFDCQVPLHTNQVGQSISKIS